jgi:2-aminoadipate transaminase
MQTPWEHRYAQRTQRMKGSAIRELLKFSERPDVISFGGGMPAPEIFPVQEFQEACTRVLQNNGPQALQYSTTEGYLPLRKYLVDSMAKSGINITPDNVLITSGSQQALDLIGKIFINHGDRILVENPTYLGALQAWNAYGAEYVSVQLDDHGLNTDHLEEALRYGPKFMYVLPNFQNPTGVSMTLERRKRLVELADHFGVPIIEDDPYGQLRYEGEDCPPVEVIDSQARNSSGLYSGNVIYMSTFSKILAPGIRLAWIVAPQEVIQKLVMAKQGMDLNTATFNQYVAYEVAKDGFIDRYVPTIRKVYHERRDVMMDALAEHMPEGIKWTHPEGGLFIWLTVPNKLDTVELFKEAVEQKVAFVPGESFYATGGGRNTMRLNFSYCPPEKINEGIARLGNAVKKFLK